ncbi:hypothetical protein [Streptomyces sp. enrichment culture]|uniref:hypothetical protein n=1 Tax=Streptomyces sp. enrichment culture TaxID=1795815 RepID=UPI003F55F434
MNTQELAKFFALLTILEPHTQTCVQAARLADAAATADEGDESDTQVVKDLRAHADKIAAELGTVDAAKLERKAAVIAKFLA